MIRTYELKRYLVSVRWDQTLETSPIYPGNTYKTKGRWVALVEDEHKIVASYESRWRWKAIKKAIKKLDQLKVVPADYLAEGTALEFPPQWRDEISAIEHEVK